MLDPCKQSHSQGTRPTLQDASSTTCTDYPRRQRQHSRDRYKRLSDEVRQQELLERYRGPLKVAFTTTACFGWNCASVFARSSDSWFSRILSLPAPSQHWIIKAIMDFAHVTNALSDIVLMLGLYYLHKPFKDDDDVTLSVIVRMFTLWNGLTILLIWCISCVDVLLPYFSASYDVSKGANETFLRLADAAASPDHVDKGLVPYIFAVVAHTVLAALKVFILFYVYADYIYILQDEATVTVANNNAISCQESSISQADPFNTWDRFIWRRQGSRHSRTPSRASSSKHQSVHNSPPQPQNQRTPRPAQGPAQESVAALEPWFEHAGPGHRMAYDDEGEGAPLDVVPNKNAVSYVWRQGGGANEGAQKEASSHRPARDMSTFDAMHMVLFGYGQRSRKKGVRQRSGKKGDEQSTGGSSASMTPIVPPGKRTRDGAPYSPGLEEGPQKRGQEAVVHENEGEQRPLQEPRPTGVDRLHIADIDTSTDQRLLIGSEESSSPVTLPEVFARAPLQEHPELQLASTTSTIPTPFKQEAEATQFQPLQSADPAKKIVAIGEECVKRHENNEQNTAIIGGTSAEASTKAVSQSSVEESADIPKPKEYKRGQMEPTMDDQPHIYGPVPISAGVISNVVPFNAYSAMTAAPSEAADGVHNLRQYNSVTSSDVLDGQNLPATLLVPAAPSLGSAGQEDTTGLRSGAESYLTVQERESQQESHVMADAHDRTVSVPRASHPPLALRGPVLVTEGHEHTTKWCDELHTTEPQRYTSESAAATDAVIRGAATAASVGENAKDSHHRDHEGLSEEQHSAEMMTGAFSVEAAHTDKTEGHDSG